MINTNILLENCSSDIGKRTKSQKKECRQMKAVPLQLIEFQRNSI